MAKTKKNKKAQSVQIPVPEFVTSGIENGKARIQDLGTQAESHLRELYDRGNTEIESVRDRLGLEEVVDRARDLETRTRGRAEELATDLDGKIRVLQDKALGLVGLATRDEVRGLAQEIDRLTRKVDRLARALKAEAAPKKAPRKSKTAKKTTRKRARKA